MVFDPVYFLFIAPALLLAFWAQYRVKSAYAAASEIPAPMSGAAAAQHILESAGVSGVTIEQTPGQLTDHYDPRDKALRLSPEVYSGRSLAAMGIAAHEVGHAIQDAHQYAPLVVRNAAVSVAGFGSSLGMICMLIGLGFVGSALGFLFWVGVALFSGVVFFQVVNLPVEFNASARAKEQLVALGIVSPEEMPYVNRVLNAAAMTYVAATLQSIMILLYFLFRAMGSRSE